MPLLPLPQRFFFAAKDGLFAAILKQEVQEFDVCLLNSTRLEIRESQRTHWSLESVFSAGTEGKFRKARRL
jgi:hypothetical protein